MYSIFMVTSLINLVIYYAVTSRLSIVFRRENRSAHDSCLLTVYIRIRLAELTNQYLSLHGVKRTLLACSPHMCSKYCFLVTHSSYSSFEGVLRFYKTTHPSGNTVDHRQIEQTSEVDQLPLGEGGMLPHSNIDHRNYFQTLKGPVTWII